MNFEDLIRGYQNTDVESEAPEGGLARVRNLETILTVVRKINTSLVLSETLELVIDEAIRITRAERGFLMLADKNNDLQFVVGRDVQGKSINPESFQVSSSVLEDVFHSGESLCIENALTDERFEQRRSIMNLELQTIICSPLRTPEETIGVIYVDSKHIQSINKDDILNLFEILAGQAAIAIKNARLYENLKEAFGDLEEANQTIITLDRLAAKGEIAAQVSHELKNLVAVVSLAFQALERRMGDSTDEGLKTIVEQGHNGAKKIQQFSMNLLSRSNHTGNFSMRDPRQVIKEFSEFMRFLHQFKHREISLSFGREIPEIRMDPDQIKQVLLNLVNNAVEASPDVNIEFRMSFDQNQKSVRIEVRDDGPGIEESIRSKILNERVTTKENGHGYGLPICRQIVEAHGGSLEVESESGRGTTFIIMLPVNGESGKPARTS